MKEDDNYDNGAASLGEDEKEAGTASSGTSSVGQSWASGTKTSRDSARNGRESTANQVSDVADSKRGGDTFMVDATVTGGFTKASHRLASASLWSAGSSQSSYGIQRRMRTPVLPRLLSLFSVENSSIESLVIATKTTDGAAVTNCS
jgi:hypothetical protein